MVRRIKQDRWKLWVIQNVESRDAGFLRDLLVDSVAFQRMVRVQQERVARQTRHPRSCPTFPNADYLHIAYRKKRKGRKK